MTARRMLAATPAPCSGGAGKLARVTAGAGSIGWGQPKEVAQIGAVIGREFHHDLLAAVARSLGARTQIGPRSAHSDRVALPAGHCPAGDLFL